MAIAALICSTLAYEVGAPLFLVIAVLTWRASRRTNGYIGPQGTLGLLAAYIASLVVVGVVKASTTVRGPSHGYVHQMLAFDVAKNLREGAAIHFGTYGAGLPLTALRLVAEYPNTKIAVCGALLGLAVFAYVFGIVRKDPASVAGARRSLKTIGAGLGLFALGFAVFVGFSDIPFTAMGITNRLAIAATVGTAVALIGVIGLISSIVPGGLVRAVVYSAGIAIVCGSGFLVINTEATFWVTAYQREREVVADIQARFPNLAPGTTIVLDGVCPYVGPAIVFDSSWDLACALRIAYADPSVDADVVRQSIEVKDTMLYAWSLGWRTDRPYGDSLFVYDYNSKTIYPLRDAAAARAYFKQSHMTCPPGEEGVGVRLF